MKLRCIHNRAHTAFVDGEYPFGVFRNTTFDPLHVGETYTPVGILVGSGSVEVVIEFDGFVASFPTELFEIVEGRIPSNWYVRVGEMARAINEEVPLVIGYRELCYDADHYERLIEGESGDIALLRRRREESSDSLSKYAG